MVYSIPSPALMGRLSWSILPLESQNTHIQVPSCNVGLPERLIPNGVYRKTE